MRLFSKRHRSVPVRNRRILVVEVLEDRSLMSVYTPAQISHAYGFDQVPYNGHGQTIAIIDAYDAPNIHSDLQKFQDSPLGMNDPKDISGILNVVYAQGAKPAYNSGWSQEATLDVQWAHAMAPGANILLVETASNSFADLFAGVDYAVTHGASVVSMSWGSNEFSSEASFDSHFNVGGVTFVASSGDTGGVVEYPAASPYVVGVGGTSLNKATYSPEESAWSGSGGGISAVESRPGYQDGVNGSSRRSTPDVAYVANPNTGVYVYWTSGTSTTGGWYSFGGTSAGAPQWAALIAVANEARGTAGALDGDTQVLPTLYAHPGDFNDITTGKAGVGRRANSASVGYDLATGLGSPDVPALIPHLVTPTTSAAPSSGSGTTTGGNGNHHVVTSTGDNGDGTRTALISAFNTRTGDTVLTSSDPILIVNRFDGAAHLPESTTQSVSVLLVTGSSSDTEDEEMSSEVTRIHAAGQANDAAPITLLTFERNTVYQGESAMRVTVDEETPQNSSVAPGNSATPPAAAVIAPAPVSAENESGGVITGSVARTLSKVFWLVGAALFFSQGCAFARAREAEIEEENKRRRAA